MGGVSSCARSDRGAIDVKVDKQGYFSGEDVADLTLFLSPLTPG